MISGKIDEKTLLKCGPLVWLSRLKLWSIYTLKLLPLYSTGERNHLHTSFTHWWKVVDSIHLYRSSEYYTRWPLHTCGGCYAAVTGHHSHS